MSSFDYEEKLELERKRQGLKRHLSQLEDDDKDLRENVRIESRLQKNTITLPPGLVPDPGAVLMLNEHGQIVLVQQGAIAGQQNVSSVALSTSNTPHKVQYVRHPTANTAQRPPTGQLVHIQHGALSSNPSAVRQTTPSPVNAVPTQQPVRVAAPQGGMQTIMRTSTPTAGSQAAAAPNAQQQAVIDNAKKCKNVLSTFIKLAASQPEVTVSSVRDLIQGLIDGKLEPELCSERLQKEFKAAPQSYLIPFLKKSLPLLRQSLLNNAMSIDGVKPPPPEIVQQSWPVSVAPVPTAVSHLQQVSNSESESSGDSRSRSKTRRQWKKKKKSKQVSKSPTKLKLPSPSPGRRGEKNEATRLVSPVKKKKTARRASPEFERESSVEKVIGSRRQTKSMSPSFEKSLSFYWDDKKARKAEQKKKKKEAKTLDKSNDTSLDRSRGYESRDRELSPVSDFRSNSPMKKKKKNKKNKNKKKYSGPSPLREDVVIPKQKEDKIKARDRSMSPVPMKSLEKRNLDQSHDRKELEPRGRSPMGGKMSRSPVPPRRARSLDPAPRVQTSSSASSVDNMQSSGESLNESSVDMINVDPSDHSGVEMGMLEDETASKATALTSGQQHNVVLREKHKQISFVDKVRLMRQHRPSMPLDPENRKAWIRKLCSIFKVEDMRRFQQSYGIHLQMAQLEQTVWAMVEESESAVKITEKFFRPLMKLSDDKIKTCLEILKRLGLAKYNEKVKEFSPVFLKKRKVEDACEMEERNGNEDLLDKYNKMAENLKASQDRCSKLEKENSELRNKLAKGDVSSNMHLQNLQGLAALANASANPEANSPMSLSSQPMPVTLELLVSVDLTRTGDDEKEPLLTGLDFLPDGRLVAVDNLNNKCTILNEQLQRLGTPYKFKDHPHSVVCVSHNTLCVTGGGGSKGVCLLSVSADNTITLTREITTSSHFFSICCMSPSNMVVSTFDDPRPARMLSVDGVESDFEHSLTFPMKTYKLAESSCTYVQSKNTLVLTDRLAHTVYMNDTVKGTSRAVTNENIQEPRGACVGPGDSVLVCSMRKHSIVRLTIDGKILGTYPVDMKFPKSMCVSKDGTRLAVSNCSEGNTKLHLYKISMAIS